MPRFSFTLPGEVADRRIANILAGHGSDGHSGPALSCGPAAGTLGGSRNRTSGWQPRSNRFRAFPSASHPPVRPSVQRSRCGAWRRARTIPPQPIHFSRRQGRIGRGAGAKGSGRASMSPLADSRTRSCHAPGAGAPANRLWGCGNHAGAPALPLGETRFER